MQVSASLRDDINPIIINIIAFGELVVSDRRAHIEPITPQHFALLDNVNIDLQQIETLSRVIDISEPQHRVSRLLAEVLQAIQYQPNGRIEPFPK